MKDVFISGQISVSTVQMMLRLCDVVFFLSLGVVCVCDSVLKAVSGQRFKIFIFPSLNKTGRHQNLQAMFFNSFLIRFINFGFFFVLHWFPSSLNPTVAAFPHVSTIALSSIFLKSFRMLGAAGIYWLQMWQNWISWVCFTAQVCVFVSVRVNVASRLITVMTGTSFTFLA